LTALAFVLIIGKAERFHCGKQVASYLGLVPLEESSGNRRRLGHITKQGSSMMRFLLVEAAQVTVRSVPGWRSTFLRTCQKIVKTTRTRFALGAYARHPLRLSGAAMTEGVENQFHAAGNAQFVEDTKEIFLNCPIRAYGPRNLMKITQSQRQNRRGSERRG